eukprot:6007706-Pleurochrysis_carterae.AAC.1
MVQLGTHQGHSQVSECRCPVTVQPSWLHQCCFSTVGVIVVVAAKPVLEGGVGDVDYEDGKG